MLQAAGPSAKDRTAIKGSFAARTLSQIVLKAFEVSHSDSSASVCSQILLKAFEVSHSYSSAIVCCIACHIRLWTLMLTLLFLPCVAQSLIMTG